MGVFESVGYKHGGWRDVGWWQRAIRPSPAEPDPPSSIADLRVLQRLEAALSVGEEWLE